MRTAGQVLINILVTGSLYAIMALGFNLTYACARLINFSFGAYAVIGAYTTYALLERWHVPVPVAGLAGMLFAGLVALLTEQLVFGPIRERKASKMVLFVASIGLFTMVQAAAAILFSTHYVPLSVFLPEASSVSIVGFIVTAPQAALFVAALLSFAALFFLFRSSLGKIMLAISDDETMARIAGVHTRRVLLFTFFLSGTLAGLGGLLAGFDTGIEPTMGLLLLLNGVIAAIIGGAGYAWGGFAGAYFLAFVDQIGILLIGGSWRNAVTFTVLALFLVFRPRGVFRRKV